MLNQVHNLRGEKKKYYSSEQSLDPSIGHYLLLLDLVLERGNHGQDNDCSSVKLLAGKRPCCPPCCAYELESLVCVGKIV